MNKKRVMIGIGSNERDFAESVRAAFGKALPENQIDIVGISVKTVANSQLFGDTQIMNQAENILGGVRDSVINADYYVGFGNGVVDRFGRLFDIFWVIIWDRKNDNYGVACSTGVEYPKIMVNWKTETIGSKMAMLVGQAITSDSQAIATKDLLNRKDLLVQAILSAFGTMK